MTKKKKHHYIPQFYLSYFTDTNRRSKEAPFLWVFNKDKEVPFKKSPHNIAFENYFYSFDTGDEISFEIEDMLSGTESEVAPLFKELLHHDFNFENTKKRFVLGKFISFMNFRTVRGREYFRILFQNTMKGKFIEKVTNEGGINHFLQKNKKEWSGKEFIDSFNKMKIVPSKVLAIEYMLHDVKKMIPSLCVRNWAFLLSMSHDHLFITSDNPVLLFNEAIKDKDYVPGILDERTDIIFPLFPNVCLYASFRAEEGFWNVPDAVVKEINKKIAYSCHKYYFSNTKRPEHLF